MRTSDEVKPADTRLKVQNVRFEPVSKAEPLMSVLKFDLLNESDDQLTDIVLKIAVVNTALREGLSDDARVIVGPFSIEGHNVLQPGYVLNYEIVMRNFSSACDCVPKVAIVSVRALTALKF